MMRRLICTPSSSASSARSSFAADFGVALAARAPRPTRRPSWRSPGCRRARRGCRGRASTSRPRARPAGGSTAPTAPRCARRPRASSRRLSSTALRRRSSRCCASRRASSQTTSSSATVNAVISCMPRRANAMSAPSASVASSSWRRCVAAMLSTSARISSIVRLPMPVSSSACAASGAVLLVERDRRLELRQLLADEAVEAAERCRAARACRSAPAARAALNAPSTFGSAALYGARYRPGRSAG